jgi:hypothetical protein
MAEERGESEEDCANEKEINADYARLGAFELAGGAADARVSG